MYYICSLIHYDLLLIVGPEIILIMAKTYGLV